MIFTPILSPCLNCMWVLFYCLTRQKGEHYEYYNYNEIFGFHRNRRRIRWRGNTYIGGKNSRRCHGESLAGSRRRSDEGNWHLCQRYHHSGKGIVSHRLGMPHRRWTSIRVVRESQSAVCGARRLDERGRGLRTQGKDQIRSVHRYRRVLGGSAPLHHRLTKWNRVQVALWLIILQKQPPKIGRGGEIRFAQFFILL